MYRISITMLYTTFKIVLEVNTSKTKGIEKKVRSVITRGKGWGGATA